MGYFDNNVKVSKNFALELLNTYNRNTINVYQPDYKYYYNFYLLNQLNLIRQYLQTG